MKKDYLFKAGLKIFIAFIIPLALLFIVSTQITGFAVNGAGIVSGGLLVISAFFFVILLLLIKLRPKAYKQ